MVTTVAANTDVELTGEPQSGWYPIQTGDVDGWIAGSLLSGPGIPRIGRLCGKTAEAAPPATAAAEPIGSVRIYGPEGGGNFGQGFPDENCANWHVRVVNQSDTAVSGFTFSSTGADYVDGYSADSTEIAAEVPAPVHVEVYVAPGTEQSVQFQACTSTPYPGGAFSFGVTPAKKITYHWVTGHGGVSDFGW